MDILDKYLSSITSSTNLLHGINSTKYKSVFTHKTYLDVIIETLNSFKTTLQIYFSGQTARAAIFLDTFFNKAGYFNYFKPFIYPPNTSFYRMRKHDGNYPLSSEEMLHIPFNLLEAISTQRYSIPGYPALYLGNSLYICWEELNRPSPFEIQCVLFKNTVPIKVLDLDWTSYYMNLISGTIDDDALVELGILWPLFAVCNIIVPRKNTLMPFKGEYIFPQMIMQSLQNQSAWPIPAIRYPSSKVKYDIKYVDNKFHNIVIPVKEIEKSGHCSRLKSFFKITGVEIWNLRDIINSSSPVSVVSSTYDNPEVKAISLDQRSFIEYKQTKFFNIEAYFAALPDTALRILT